jgi:acetone carboxylase gamma subunit
MRRVLDSLAIELGPGREVYRCLECDAVLGDADRGWQAHAMTFVEPIEAGEPEALARIDDGFVLRHYCCPSCATLFDVEMVPAVEPVG